MKTINIKQKLKEYFFLNPTEKLRVRQIERKVKVPLPSVLRYTKELEKEQILKSTLIANIKLFSANRNSNAFLIEKKLFNINSLYSSNLVQFLITEYDNPTIVVFGSYVLGEDIESSDIDIYIETPKKEIKGLELFERKLKRNIQIFSHKSIQEIKNKELANNILNGLTINGYLEVFK